VFTGKWKGGFGMIETAVAVQAYRSHGFIFGSLFSDARHVEVNQRMTFPALHRFMKSLKGEPRFVMIKPGSRLKGVEPMAFLTIGFQLLLVKILVTGKALIGNRTVKHCFTGSGRKALRLFEVAFLAGSGPVFSLQGVIRILLVVEFQEFPLKSCGKMAGLTLFSELPQVNVPMTTGTIDFQGFIDDGVAVSPGIMTFVTGNGTVFAGEGITAAIVVILIFFKSFHHMAGFAVFIELSPVGVSFMAVATIGKGQLTCFLPVGMTLFTG
jgi:hypothetical protein